jgi:hypothetical protein
VADPRPLAPEGGGSGILYIPRLIIPRCPVSTQLTPAPLVWSPGVCRASLGTDHGRQTPVVLFGVGRSSPPPPAGSSRELRPNGPQGRCRTVSSLHPPAASWVGEGDTKGRPSLVQSPLAIPSVGVRLCLAHRRGNPAERRGCTRRGGTEENGVDPLSAEPPRPTSARGAAG